MTYLQLINAVMRRLREDEVTSYTQTAYSKLIGDFVNESKREVEDAWNWLQLRTTITVNTVADTYSYTLTGSGDRYRVLQVLDNTNDGILQPAPWRWLNMQLTANNAATGLPGYYGINGQTGGDADMDFYPIPDGAYTLLVHIVVPQADFSSDNTEMTVPDWPVILGAHAKALSERGEDGSTMYAEVMNNYYKAMSDAIALDAVNEPEELIWTYA